MLDAGNSMSNISACVLVLRSARDYRILRSVLPFSSALSPWLHCINYVPTKYFK